jgi:hypothetical protein
MFDSRWTRCRCSLHTNTSTTSTRSGIEQYLFPLPFLAALLVVQDVLDVINQHGFLGNGPPRSATFHSFSEDSWRPPSRVKVACRPERFKNLFERSIANHHCVDSRAISTALKGF